MTDGSVLPLAEVLAAAQLAQAGGVESAEVELLAVDTVRHGQLVR